MARPHSAPPTRTPEGSTNALSTQSANISSELSSTDVAARLLARGKESQRLRTELIRKRELEEAQEALRKIPVSKGTELIAAHNEGIR